MPFNARIVPKAAPAAPAPKGKVTIAGAWKAVASGGVSSAPTAKAGSVAPRGGGIAASIVGAPPAVDGGSVSTAWRAMPQATASSSDVNPSGVGAWLRKSAFASGSALSRATGAAPAPGDFFKRLASAITQPTASIATMNADVQNAPGFAPTSAYAPSNVIPFPASGGGGGGGGDGGGGGSGGGGSWGGGAASDDGGQQPGDGEDYPGDENDSGGYSEYGGGDPADTFNHDRRAIEETERFSPPDVDRAEDGGGGYASDSGAGFDHDADEDEGGQDYAQQSPPLAASSGQEESWSYRDRRPMTIPGYMYTAPAYRPGGEEGDDSMDATGYLSALNDSGQAFSGAEDFFKSLGKNLAISGAQQTLVAANKALGGSGAKPVVVPTAPPMTLGKKVFIGVAVAVPVLYFLTRHRAPSVVSNPRRRWAYMPIVKNSRKRRRSGR